MDELTAYEYAKQCFELKQYDDAKILLNVCLKKNPDFGYAYVLFGHIYSICNEPLDAMENYLEAYDRLKDIELQFACALIEKELNGLPAGEKYIHDFEYYFECTNPYIMNQLGVLLYKEKAYSRAVYLFLRLIKDVTKSDVHPRLINLTSLLDGYADLYWNPVYINLGYTLFFQKKYCNALACFKKAVANGTDRCIAWEMIGFCYRMLGMFHSANNAMFKANILDPRLKHFIPLM